MTEYDEELRARLSRIDPAPAGLDVDPVTSPRAQELLEHTMTQTLDTPAEAPAARPRWRRRPAVLAAAASVLVAVGVAVAVAVPLMSSDDAPAQRRPTSVALSLPASGGTVMSSCMMFDVAILRQMPVALAGTVTAVSDERVTLDVDRWYKGGTADQVTVAQPGANTSASLDGVAFEQGKRYLLTATDGTVNGCGFSGPATPELEKSYAEAFGS